ncbi:hypothetical protein [Candidatus Gromoviella agglomerans]|uniref:hypothetical protein n=1 Tax=Candidatus Gromoviella agglomerans TaxID=2806609 RepID=UPI001E445521|nr:hypothetical protein [Candidatus Gromoviella agglomerans]
MNYYILKRIFFNNIDCAKLLFSTLDIGINELPSDNELIDVKTQFGFLSAFELSDMSSVMIFHDSDSIFVGIFSEGVLVKIDEMLIKIFEKAYSSVFRVSQKMKLKDLNILFFSKKHLFNQINVFIHEYISSIAQQRFAEEKDQPRVSMFDNVKVKIVELHKGFLYSQNNLLKIICGFLCGNQIYFDESDNSFYFHSNTLELNKSETPTYVNLIDENEINIIKYMLNMIKPVSFSNEELMYYYDNQSKRAKLLDVQKDAFEEGFKLGHYDGRISTAYLIKSLLSEKNPNIDEFLTNLCYIKADE